MVAYNELYGYRRGRLFFFFFYLEINLNGRNNSVIYVELCRGTAVYRLKSKSFGCLGAVHDMYARLSTVR